jgi:hypothetical protein
MNEVVCVEEDFENYAIMAKSSAPNFSNKTDDTGAIWKMHFDEARL